MAILKYRYWCFLILLSVCGCNKTDTTQIDPQLIGRWTDKNVNYYFNSSLTYGEKYLRKGSGIDTVLTDSAYGNYTLDINNHTITFLITGVKMKSGTVLGTNLNGGVWNYSISDTVLTYTTLTSNGRLVKF